MESGNVLRGEEILRAKPKHKTNILTNAARAGMLSVFLQIGVAGSSEEPQPIRAPRVPHNPPRYITGEPVEWRDGSRGIITGKAVWQNGDEHGDWYYIVRFRPDDPDGLAWSLSEQSLRVVEDKPSIIK